MDDVRYALQQRAEAHLSMIGTLYGADLELQRVSPTLRGKIRALVETEKAALDGVAERLVGGEAHYPLAPQAESFDAFLDKFVPGIRVERPDVAAMIGRHQPYSVAALAHLRELLMEDRWQHLTPETRPAPPEADPPAPAPDPSPAEPTPIRSPRPPTGLGAGLAGSVFVNGVEYDPITLKPLNPPPPPKREVVYVDWVFALNGGDVSALATLEAIHTAVTTAVDEISTAGGLS